MAAVRIGEGFPYVMVEARKMTDPFEAGMPATGDGQERGIASEGVIAYRVQTRNPTVQTREGNKKPLYLMTLKALQPGESAALDDGVTLTVTAARPTASPSAWMTPVSISSIAPRPPRRSRRRPPCALVLDGPAIENIAYLDTGGHMDEISPRAERPGDDRSHCERRRAERAGVPFTYFDPAGNQVVLIFGADNQVRSLLDRRVGHDNLTGSHAERAANNHLCRLG